MANTSPKLMNPNQMTTHRATGGIRNRNIVRTNPRLVKKQPLNRIQAVVRREQKGERA